ncbi:putative M18 family aminopeptidase 2 [Andreesenia angusta]|uniref:M18 family aminopeptidase n=1 Tax=Andreesenia angusta TaxID=39480 RepID=A0A1S1V6K5_9FIRM|nr:M18 family aminopeptidase [Andreesenia angusta]OHW62258.1 putative M18 family aminopeptidase 2 [Andreesenia angusta]
MDRVYDFADELLDFVENSPSQYHVVKTLEDRFRARGFQKLELSSNWEFKSGDRCYLSVGESMSVGFIVGSGELEECGFRVVASHTDSPGIVVKPDPEISSDGYLKLNCELYGGPIMNTWLDRPLGLAGRVVLKGDSPMSPKTELIDFKKPVALIPNLAIHQNRKVNEGLKLSGQKDMLPFLKTVEKNFEKESYLINQLASELGVDSGEILDFELCFYEHGRGCIFGINREFISCGKLDNLAMAHSSAEAILDSETSFATSVFVSFNHEEIGSTTAEGAGSPALQNILERIALGLGKQREEYLRALENSFMLSCDMVHAVHPNNTEKQDPTNRPVINGGPAVKTSARKSYTSDAETYSVYKSICDSIGVNVQRYVNHSDERGGSTIGPISSTQLAIKSVDIGNPLLAMHSIRETAGVKDHYDIYRSFVEFYKAR